MPKLYKNPWFNIKKRVPNATMRLFCFPYAGGSAQIYDTWHENVPAGIEVIAVQYPGRGSRFVDPLIGTCQGMVEAILPNILPFTDKPFAFFGHSNGGLVSFELARALEQKGVSSQIHHFLSAKRAIHLPAKKRVLHSLPEDQFIEELVDLGGTPPEILAQKELMELFIPILRSDFSLSETFTYQGEHQLSCPATLLYGEKDDDVPEEDVFRWQELIKQPVAKKKFSGDHFFINNQREQVLSFLHEQLTILLADLE